MNPLSRITTEELGLIPLARELLTQSARWGYLLNNKELRVLYGILITMLHDVHPNQANMQTLEALILRVPDGARWWQSIEAACKAKPSVGSA
jgi:hypothetical protein